MMSGQEQGFLQPLPQILAILETLMKNSVYEMCEHMGWPGRKQQLSLKTHQGVVGPESALISLR